MGSGGVRGFAPSVNGFAFANDFPKAPLIRFLGIPIGNASKGICGGMAFAARDLFEANLAPPVNTSPPDPGTNLYRYLVRRLLASFDLPMGPLRYLAWMWLPNGNRFGIHGVTWRTIRRHWPRIQADLDRQVLSPLGLVRARGNPLELGRNHQVLAFGYELDETASTLTVRAYDPNHPGDDQVALRLSIADPSHHAPIGYVAGEDPVYGFFRTGYSRPDPVKVREIGSSRPRPPLD
jgi:hypothetical protein